MKKVNKIAETELEIMRVIWKNEKPTTSTEIVKKIQSFKDWEDTTIYTMISRLVKKGFLIQDKKQVSYYFPTISEKEYLFEQTDELVDKLFGGDAKQLVSMLFEGKKVKTSDIEDLKKYWGSEIKNERDT